MTKAIGGKHRTTLREKATGNHAIDSYAFSRMPHLFFVLASEKYYPKVPVSLLLTLFFLWDRTVGDDAVAECGDIALSQIPVRRQEKVKWLAAFEAAGFFERKKPKSGGANHESTWYAYSNPTADEWDEFFRRAEILVRFENWDKVSKEEFSQHFADIRSGQQRRPYYALLDMLGRGQQPDSSKKKTEATVRLAGPPKP
jgi:hypothetical protein